MVDHGAVWPHHRAMNFADRITRTALPFDPDRAADARALLPDMPPNITEIIAGVGGCSPYLLRLLEVERDWIGAALMAPPEQALADVMEQTRAPNDDLSAHLRRGKRRLALLAGLCDVAGVWDLEQVTQALTDYADLAVDRAIRAEVGREIARGKLPDTGDDTGGLVAIAMGKMGAGELNYSSDIDLICLFDETRYDPDAYFDVRASLIRATRRMAGLLNDITDQGYVFRTDLRLRPDPSSTPVCMAMEPAERYYESLGRTWERAAYIKARAAAGDVAAGAAFLDRLKPFVWRKHLDFAAIEDAHDIRLKIRDHKIKPDQNDLFGHNMKLGRGGIREIEFFTQTRQLISGGRDADLRHRGTKPALAALADKGWVAPEISADLAQHYTMHREVEHRLQMINDAQTHDLPTNLDGMARVANFMGYAQPQELLGAIRDRISAVHMMTEGFFAPSLVSAPEVASLGISDAMSQVIEGWPTYPALRSPRAVEIFDRIKPALVARLAQASDPENALAKFDGFLQGLPAGVQLFSLFEANPQLIDLMVDIAATAPALARYLSRNAKVFDAVIGGAFFDEWPDIATLGADFDAAMAELGDYEARLDGARRWQKEWHFRIGVHHLRGLIDAAEAGRQYAELAEVVLSGVWPIVAANFAVKHGAEPGKGAVVLGMGSLGATRLHAASDLDLIVVYDPEDQDQSDGPRVLAVRAYYARLTQAFVTAISAPMAEGRLYEVDMRLRPSGRQGPVATSLTSFRTYQEEEAWVWEHLALTRARPVAANRALGAEIERFREGLLARVGKPGRVWPEVAEMRARIAEAKAPGSIWEAKIGAGRLQDVELTAQALCLVVGSAARSVREQLRAAVDGAAIASDQAVVLQEAADAAWRLQAASRLLTDEVLDMAHIGAGGRAFLQREMGAKTVDAMERDFADRVARAAEVIAALLAPHEVAT